MGVPKNSCFMLENPIPMDDLGYKKLILNANSMRIQCEYARMTGTSGAVVPGQGIDQSPRATPVRGKLTSGALVPVGFFQDFWSGSSSDEAESVKNSGIFEN